MIKQKEERFEKVVERREDINDIWVLFAMTFIAFLFMIAGFFVKEILILAISLYFIFLILEIIGFFVGRKVYYRRIK